MKHWKKLLALTLCACLIAGLTACGSEAQSANSADEQTEEAGSSVPQMESPQPEDGQAEDTNPEDTNTDSAALDEDEVLESEESEGGLSEAEQQPTDPEEENMEEAEAQDGEARTEITQEDALQVVVDHFDTEDAGSGYAYAYTLVRADEIDGQSYYIYRQSWAEDEEDAEAGAKTLRYIFVATDGSVLYTGVVDGEQAIIDYDSEIIP